jgi:uncharacterized glyoxalase superfamily protein PhnB
MATLNAIGIVVSDMHKALAFYRLLGLEIPEPAAGEDHVEAKLPSGVRLMWDTEELIKSFDPDWTRPTGSRIGLAFECTSPAEVNALHAHAVASGYWSHKDPWDAFWGQRYAQLCDPDGSVVDLFAAIP